MNHFQFHKNGKLQFFKEKKKFSQNKKITLMNAQNKILISTKIDTKYNV